MTVTCEALRILPPTSPAAMRRVAIAIPAYNEGRHLAEVIARCRAVQPALICVVDDCSTDDTAAVLRREAARGGAPLVVLHNPENLGKQGSVRRALKRLACEPIDAVALIDGDLQHDPGDLPPLVALLARYDAVIGARSKAEMPWQRRLSNWLVNRTFAAIAGIDFVDVQSGLRLYRLPLATALGERLPERGGFGVEHATLQLLAELARTGPDLRVVAAPISCRYGDEKSHIGPRDLIHLARATFSKAFALRRQLRAPRALPPAPPARLRA